MLRSQRFCFCILCTAIGLALAWLFLVNQSTTQAAPAKSTVSFIKDVAPILKENCFACHDARKRKGKLNLTTIHDMRKGGRSEIDPIVPGKPEESYLIELMKADDVTRMPPKDSGDAVSKEQIAIIEKWIQEGAKIDAEVKADADLLKELRIRWTPPTPPASYQYPVIVTALAFTKDAKKIVAGGHHELTIWNLETAKLEKRIRTRAERTYAMEFLADGKLVVAGGRPGQEGDVRVYNLDGGKPIMEDGVAVLDGVKDKSVMVSHLLDSEDSVLCLDVSGDGKRLVSGGTDRLVHVWNISGGVTAAKLEQTIENHADWVFGVTLADDNKHLLSASRDKTAKVWDLNAKESVMTFPSHQEPVYGVTVSKDGKLGFSVGEDKQIRSWNITGNRRQVRAGGGHGDSVFKVLRHPDNKTLVTCSADKTIRFWETRRMRATRTLSGHSDQVYALTFSSDGKLLASGAYDGEIRIWNATDGKLIKAFNASPGFKSVSTSKK